MVRVQSFLLFALGVSSASIPWKFSNIKNALSITSQGSADPIPKAHAKDDKISGSTFGQQSWKNLKQDLEDIQHRTTLNGLLHDKNRVSEFEDVLDDKILSAEEEARLVSARARQYMYVSTSNNDVVSAGDVTTIEKSMERIVHDIDVFGNYLRGWSYSFGEVYARWRAMQIDFKIAQRELDSSARLDKNGTSWLLNYTVEVLEPSFQQTYLLVVANKGVFKQWGNDGDVAKLLLKDRPLIKSFGDTLVSKVSFDQIELAKYAANRMSTTVEFTLREFTPSE